MVPISSDHFPENAILRSRELSLLFGSAVHFLYVVEKKTILRMEETGRYALTPTVMKEIEKNIIWTQLEDISEAVMDRVKELMKEGSDRCSYEVCKGEFSEEIASYIMGSSREGKAVDCVVIEYEKDSDLHYRILEQCTVPIWLDRGGEIGSILAATTCLSRNELVPEYGSRLGKAYGASMVVRHFSAEGKVEPPGTPMGGKKNANAARDWYGATHLERAIIKEAGDMKADLIIIGRTCEARNFLWLGTHFPKVNVAKKANMNVLIMYSL